MNRRTLLRATALAPLAAIGPAFAQAGWPDRVLRIVVPFVPGSFTDVSARLLANGKERLLITGYGTDRLAAAVGLG